ncbi:hypothetical protein AALB_0641 [Agarivorans albus MKT 106]|uniref:Uncharacterized protein n=1 Tax=Agarivorans albus MKT 106 TaxID=1331007 RepID=R9PR17_AGAAL|nr:hypothetical protein AALB_0641 [Agarivorans albus MKT 106]
MKACFLSPKIWPYAKIAALYPVTTKRVSLAVTLAPILLD